MSDEHLTERQKREREARAYLERQFGRHPGWPLINASWRTIWISLLVGAIIGILINIL